MIIKGEKKVEDIEFMSIITKETSSLEVSGVVVEIGVELPKELF